MNEKEFQKIAVIIAILVNVIAVLVNAMVGGWLFVVLNSLCVIYLVRLSIKHKVFKNGKS